MNNFNILNVINTMFLRCYFYLYAGNVGFAIVDAEVAGLDSVTAAGELLGGGGPAPGKRGLGIPM